MADVVNLRRERKRKRRENTAAAADESRRAFGVSPTSKSARSAERALESARLEGHRRTLNPPAGDDPERL